MMNKIPMLSDYSLKPYPETLGQIEVEILLCLFLEQKIAMYSWTRALKSELAKQIAPENHHSY